MLENLMGILMSIKITDIIDISVVAYLLYVLLGYIKKTRAQQLFRGILLLIAFFLVSEIFNLSLLNWLFTRLITVGLIAVVIVFQPEIRRGLEQLGRSEKWLNSILRANGASDGKNVFLFCADQQGNHIFLRKEVKSCDGAC